MFQQMFLKALSIRGKRRVECRGEFYLGQSTEVKVAECSGKHDGVVFAQDAGHVYLSSPCYYEHGVDYPEGEWHERIIAIQFRF